MYNRFQILTLFRKCQSYTRLALFLMVIRLSVTVAKGGERGLRMEICYYKPTSLGNRVISKLF